VRRSARFISQTEEFAGSVFAQEEVTLREPRKKKASAVLPDGTRLNKATGGRDKENQLPPDQAQTALKSMDDIETSMKELALNPIDLNCESSRARKPVNRRKRRSVAPVKTSLELEEEFPVFSPPPVEAGSAESAAQSAESLERIWSPGRTFVVPETVQQEEEENVCAVHEAGGCEPFF
jgi:hypothetical protein